MANIFKLTQGYAEKPKRNVYDLSFSNNITANFGTLYPVFCKEVNPGDSMKIDTSFGLRAQPMIFPIQTKMRADIHYFYVRNRTLWKDWMDFYGKTKDGLVHPYIDRPISDFKTKSIYDFLGIPTTILAESSFSNVYSVNPYNIMDTQIAGRNATTQVLSSGFSVSEISSPLYSSLDKINKLSIYNLSRPFYFKGPSYIVGSSFLSLIATSATDGYPYLCYPLSPIPVSYIGVDNEGKLLNKTLTFVFPDSSLSLDPRFSVSEGFCSILFFAMKSSQNSLSVYNREIYYSGYFIQHPDNVDSILTPSVTTNKWIDLSGDVYTVDNFKFLQDDGFDMIMPVLTVRPVYSLFSSLADTSLNIGGFYYINGVSSSKIIDASELSYLPWCGNNKQLKIDVLPYRAYEAIYNSFYRNVQNDPFKINGVAEYNKYVTNLDGGADSFPYKLYQRNWELDFLTSAVQSPQQGLAPLVGVTVNNADSTATFKFQSEALNNGQPITATASVSDDGDVIGLQYYDPELPQSNIDRLMQAINYGISINDIRQTNALQRWLEKNIRRGYRYRDQLLSHFGVSVSYNELLMPEFIGGVSQDVETQTIFQTVTNENGYLGDYAGRGSVVGQSRNSVSKYCDEAGFIIGIMSIVPIPVYSQVPAGYAFKSNLMDYYFPEFGKIGMQPIYNYHVTPLQTSPTQLNDVFGYQRPWWDLISSVDEVHGEFRSSANGYLIHRQFAETPVLNGNFLKIDNKYINDVFAITDTEVSDQFRGVVNFHVTKKTSIPLHGEPSIE